MAITVSAPRSLVRRRAGGYQKSWPLFNRFADTMLASIILLAASPLSIIVAILIKLQDGGPVFYKGERLGKNKRIFDMYKFRTLSVDAEKLIGGDLLSKKHHVVTPFGKFFSDTRIDEIPQLYNVILGDMDFVGPRPERQAVYDKQCKEIGGYDKRFTVHPGLIGYSQLFTPHSAPKRIRTLIDNIHLDRKQFPLEVTALIIWAFTVMIRNLFGKFFQTMWRWVVARFHGFDAIEKRLLDRVRPKGTKLFIQNGEAHTEAFLGDINDDCILAYTDQDIVKEDIRLKMTIHLRKFNRWKRKTVYCSATVQSKRELENMNHKFAYVLRYEPVSSLNQYFFDQYFLIKSII